MNRFPWFPMYTSDWLSSKHVTIMGTEWEGPYIRLLCYMWEDPDCALPDDDEELSRLSRGGDGWFDNGSRLVRKCLVPHPTKKGYLTNTRMYHEFLKREQWSDKSRAGGIKSGEARRSKAKGGSTVGEPEANDIHPHPHREKKEKTPLPPGGGDASPKAPRKQREKFKAPTMADVEAYIAEKGYKMSAEEFMDYYEANGWRVGKNPMKKWMPAAANWERRNFSGNNGQAGEVPKHLQDVEPFSPEDQAMHDKIYDDRAEGRAK